MIISPLPFRIEWDSKNRKEIEEAKKIYQQARKEKREITLLDNTPIENFNPEHGELLIKAESLKENQIETKIIDESGDRRIVWDCTSKKETEEACTLFNTYLSKGWRAYAIGMNGKKIKKIIKFDPVAEEIIFEESSLRESLNKFIKTFQEIKMTPSTYPG